MFHFFKKRFTDLSAISVDMHNHILPGLDDGAEHAGESLAIRRALAEWGIERCIYTPHIFEELYPNTPKSIQKAFDGLRTEPGFQAFAQDTFAAEYMLDASFEQRLAKPEKLLGLKDAYVLVELPLYAHNYLTENVFFELSNKGYRPVLAHPERYVFLHQSPEGYQQLKNRGCLFQINLLSLAGYYGKPVQKQAERLLKAGLVDLISTDIHRSSQLAVLERLLRSKDWAAWAERYSFQNQTLFN